jgi:hypothetical protein
MAKYGIEQRLEPIDYGNAEAVKARKARLIELFGKSRRAGRKRMESFKREMAEKCHKANPTISSDRFFREMENFGFTRIVSLRFLADDHAGLSVHDIALHLGVQARTITTWLNEPKFAFLLENLTTAYRLGILKPLIVEVIVEGLNRRYQTDVYCETSDTSGKGAAITHAKGDRIFDSVTVGLLKEAKGFCDIPTEVNRNIDDKDLSKEEKEQEARERAEILNDPVLCRTLKRAAEQVEAEIPPETIKQLEQEAVTGTEPDA